MPDRLHSMRKASFDLLLWHNDDEDEDEDDDDDDDAGAPLLLLDRSCRPCRFRLDDTFFDNEDCRGIGDSDSCVAVETGGAALEVHLKEVWSSQGEQGLLVTVVDLHSEESSGTKPSSNSGVSALTEHRDRSGVKHAEENVDSGVQRG